MILSLDSSPTAGALITENHIVKVYLKELPSVEPLLLPIEISYRECLTDAFIAPTFDDITIDYPGTMSPIELYLDFDQSPCSFEQVYEAYIIRGPTGTTGLSPLPPFITLT